MAEGISKSVGLCAFSRGTLGADGLPADEKAVLVCKENEIDISSHRASSISAHDLEIADFVLCMEKKHIDNLRQSFPLYAHKVFLLGEFGGVGEIEDPIGKDVEEYRKTFEKIKRCIDGLKRKLESM